MSKTIDDIRNEVLSLSVDERASLAHDLILSLDSPDSLALYPEMEEEISRRSWLVESGSANARPAETVIAEIKAGYRT